MGDTMTELELRRRVGWHAREKRERAGLHQATVARSAGLSRLAVVRLEASQKTPSSWTLYRLAGALECSLDDLTAPIPSATEEAAS